MGFRLQLALLSKRLTVAVLGTLGRRQIIKVVCPHVRQRCDQWEGLPASLSKVEALPLWGRGRDNNACCPQRGGFLPLMITASGEHTRERTM